MNADNSQAMNPLLNSMFVAVLIYEVLKAKGAYTFD